MTTRLISLLLLAFTLPAFLPAQEPAPVKETVVDSPLGVKFKVRMEGPYTAVAPLQVVCYFKYTEEGAKKMAGAPVELDKHMGGVIASLRSRGEFIGDELETILLKSPPGSIKADKLLLIGLGEEKNLSRETLSRVGRVAFRAAAAAGASKAAFAPLIRDQGNSTIPTGEVEIAIIKSLLLAYDTEKGLQKEGYASEYSLDEWIVEAGPKYYDETVAAVKKAVEETKEELAKRAKEAPYRTMK